MPALLKKVSTVTEKGQVTIPKSVRDALGLGPGGRVAFYIDENRRVSIERQEEDDASDPAIDSFLAFLANDMQDHPERIADFPPALIDSMHELSRGMPSDPDEPISGDVSL